MRDPMRDGDDEVELDEAEAGDEAPRARRWRTVSILAGSTVAIAAMGALGYWLYDLTTRDMREIPVVAAATGPLKTRPESAGTTERHGDIETYNLAHQGDGTASASRPTVLAPETGPPSEEDISLRDLEDILGVATPASAPAAAPLPQAADPVPDGEAGYVGSEIASRGDAGAAVLPPDEPEPDPLPPDEPAPVTGPAPEVSPVAPRRPADLPQRVAAARQAAVADVSALSARAAAAPYQLQLGAFRSEEQTRSQWSRISAAYPELLNNRALAVQPTQSGGQTFYRLRVGPFTSLAEAASVCEALIARDQPCIPAENR